MRTVFFGYGELGAVVLEALLEHHTVSLVVTHRPQFTGLDEPHVLELAQRHGLAVQISAHAREPEVAARVGAAEPSVLVSTNWRTRLPGYLLSIAKLGAVNVHDALLPAYSGFGAINWAIRNGATRTGVTVHLMEEELDTGPILAQSVVPIGPHETAWQVYRAVTALYVPTTLRALAERAAGSAGMPQDPSKRTFYHRITLADTEIDWTRSSQDIYNLVRGQSDPYINAWTTLEGQRIAIKSAALPAMGFCGTPGKVVRDAEGGVAVVCGELGTPGARGIVLHQIQPEGQEVQAARDFFKKMGSCLGR